MLYIKVGVTSHGLHQKIRCYLQSNCKNVTTYMLTKHKDVNSIKYILSSFRQISLLAIDIVSFDIH